MAVDCLGSFLRFCRPETSLQIIDDGSLLPADIAILHEKLPECTVVERVNREEEIEEYLRKCPTLRSLRYTYPQILKLTDIPFVTGGPWVKILDSDIFFLRPCGNPFDLIGGDTQAVFMRDRENSYSVRSYGLMMSQRLMLPSRANVGIVAMAASALDWEWIEWFAGRRFHNAISHVLEQTIWAAIGMRIGCKILSDAQIRVMRDDEGDGGDLLAGHFTARSRHLLPKYVERVKSVDSGAARRSWVLTDPGRCSVSDLLAYEIRRALRKVWAADR